MREYQIMRGNPYRLDRDIYMQMFYLIRSYPKLINRRQQIIYGSPAPPDGMPKGNGTCNPTERKAISLEVISCQLSAIEQTIIQLNSKYEKTYTGERFDAYEAYSDYGVYCYFRSKKCKDLAPCQKTWKRYRSEFAYLVAEKLGYAI